MACALRTAAGIGQSRAHLLSAFPYRSCSPVTRTSAMRSSSLCCTPPLPPALLSLLPLPPLLPSSMFLTARLPLCLCCPGGCAWRLDQCALPEAAPAIFVPGGAVAQTRLAGEGNPAGMATHLCSQNFRR
uniref:Uncharacterized protein n=1 Tax=Mus musculus TaxID=10090 RepID=Q8C4M2_MOUSE|nr:unnamed protein product [Mus musculus]